MFGIDENKINVIRIPQGRFNQVHCVKSFLKDITDITRVRLMTDNYTLKRVLSDLENVQKGEFIIFYSKHAVEKHPMFNIMTFSYEYNACEYVVNRKRYNKCDMAQLSKLYNRKKLIKKMKDGI